MPSKTRLTGRETPRPGHRVPAPRGAGPSTPAIAGLLSDEQRKAMADELDAELRERTRHQVREQPWPGRLRTWRVSAEGRVFAAVQTARALVWLDAGPAPTIDRHDPRVQRLLADHQARRAARRPPRGVRT